MIAAGVLIATALAVAACYLRFRTPKPPHNTSSPGAVAKATDTPVDFQTIEDFANWVTADEQQAAHIQRIESFANGDRRVVLIVNGPAAAEQWLWDMRIRLVEAALDRALQNAGYKAQANALRSDAGQRATARIQVWDVPGEEGVTILSRFERALVELEEMSSGFRIITDEVA